MRGSKVLEIWPPAVGTPPVIDEITGEDPVPRVELVVPCVPLMVLGR